MYEVKSREWSGATEIPEMESFPGMGICRQRFHRLRDRQPSADVGDVR